MQKTLRKNQEKMKEQAGDFLPNRNYKSRLFEMIFSDRKELLELYNAVNGTNYQDPEALEINTLDSAIYMSMHNDISFIIDSRLTLYEHQSTYNPNLPLRLLMYVTDLYSGITEDANLYGTKIVKIPTPRFVVFYNGKAEIDDMRELRLSEAFIVEESENWLELKAVLMNINKGHNVKLLESCKTLGDYAEYTERVRRYAGTMSLQRAVERAVEECIRDNVLADFLRNNRAEAVKVSIYEYDEEKTMRQMREEGREEGRKEGEEFLAELIKMLMRDLRTEDLQKAVEDKKFREKLYLEYGLK